jgi:zinc/manganese transport system substrate-binding protein
VPHRLHVVATTPVLGEVVEAVAGDRADVTVLMDRTDDPRTFTLTPPSIGDGGGDGGEDPLASADLVVAVDPATYELGLAPAIAAMRTGDATGDPRVLTAVGVLDARRVDGTPDPHVWLDPDRFTTLAHELASALAERSGTDAGPWNAAATAYGAQLALADEQVQATLLPPGPEQHRVLVSDDRLGYVADRYGIELVLVPPDADANPLDMDVDRLGPPGSPTGSVAGLLTSIATRIAAGR